ncbi:unnamed protein product [Phyllotreta striolata]|uniref:Cyclin-like domain-containing protein n=1 Tax=Phyllotreta striolata TaxID=444603 RepID=A0A9N9TP47_PHYSR|nr:unnamed protein product [Phyllotreta striolata]
MRPLMKENSAFCLQKEAWEDIKEYKDNYKKVIKDREQFKVNINYRSPQFSYRKNLVNHIKKVCIEKKLSQCCLHLAVYLLDVFMGNNLISRKNLYLTANVCLLIAAKFEESSHLVPRIAELNSTVNDRYNVVQYKQLEIDILNFFGFFVMFPRAAHYVYYYIQLAIFQEDITNRGVSLRNIFYDLHERITMYLDMILDNLELTENYHPSKLAAGIIALSRLDNGLSCWTEQLQDITDYELKDIETEILAINHWSISEDNSFHVQTTRLTNFID